MGFSIDGPPTKDAGGSKFDPVFVTRLADFILAGNGYAAGASGPVKTNAVRDDDGVMVGHPGDADTLRGLVITDLVKRGAMVTPAGLNILGSVFTDADGVPDGWSGLTIKSTSDYPDNPDSGPGKFGLWVGKPNAQAGRKRVKNGNGGQTPNAG